jgi:hypothetical protein
VAVQSPPSVPALPPGASAWEHIENLIELWRVEPQIWSLYVGCKEPRTEVISEDLLHFKVNKFDEFETPPEPAYSKICGYALGGHLKTGQSGSPENRPVVDQHPGH